MTPETAFCPKCHDALVFVTCLPHPRSPQMRKTTFVCYPCNRTWTYSLATEMAALYGSEPPLEASA
jgi:hypothetical protein